jgi:hypothetical protein
MIDEHEQARLRELDAALGAVPLPAGLHARIVASAEVRAGRRHLVAALVIATAAVVLAFVVGRSMAPAPVVDPVVVSTAEHAPVTATDAVAEPPKPSRMPASHWDGRLQPEHDCVLEGEAEIAVRGDCRLRLVEPSLSIDVWGGAGLVAAADGVRVQRGVALFHVDPVALGRPRVRVEVSAGTIEVIGTRFVVTQLEGGGHVDLLEGSIAFVDREGAEHAVAAGQRLGWDTSRVHTEATPIAAPIRAPRPTTPASAPLDVDAALEKIAALRRAGRYDDAVAQLVRLRRSVDDPSTAQVLSFEEGTLRMHADRPDEICAFWRGHLARFGPGDHAASIEDHMTTAGCTDP